MQVISIIVCEKRSSRKIIKSLFWSFLFCSVQDLSILSINTKQCLFKVSTSIHGSVLLYYAKALENSIKNADGSFQFLYIILKSKHCKHSVVKIFYPKEDIAVSNWSINWRWARFFVLMICWTNVSFVQAQRFWRRDSDLGESTVNMTLIFRDEWIINIPIKIPYLVFSWSVFR